MTTLPNSLNHCYDRLMEDIDESNLETVQKAFTWLLFSARPLTVAELAEAVVIKSDEPYFDAAERFDDENSVLTVIPAGFVKVVFANRSRDCNYAYPKDLFRSTGFYGANKENFHSRPTVQFAHQSVKEYLLSLHLSGHRFNVEPIAAHDLMRETCLGYLIHVLQELSMIDGTRK